MSYRDKYFSCHDYRETRKQRLECQFNCLGLFVPRVNTNSSLANNSGIRYKGITTLRSAFFPMTQAKILFYISFLNLIMYGYRNWC